MLFLDFNLMLVVCYLHTFFTPTSTTNPLLSSHCNFCYDENYAQGRKSSSGTPSVDCFYCKRSGHTLEKCRAMLASQRALFYYDATNTSYYNITHPSVIKTLTHIHDFTNLYPSITMTSLTPLQF